MLALQEGICIKSQSYYISTPNNLQPPWMNIPHSLIYNLQLRGDFPWIFFKVSLKISAIGNGGVNEPLWRRGVLVLNIATFEGSGFLGLNISNTISLGSRPKKSQVAWQCITTGHTRHGRRVVMLMGHWNLCRADFQITMLNQKHLLQ